jgi:hypothetical protein
MYKVFNTSTGEYEDQPSLEEAKAKHNQFVDSYVTRLLKEKVPHAIQIWESEKQLAESFYQSFFGEYSKANYEYTNFDIQNGQLKSRCFRFINASPNRLIKINESLVLEVYELCNEEPNQFSITYDLTTKQPVYKYFIEEGVFVKKDFYTNEILATTSDNPLAQELQELLNNYPDIKNLVLRHGQREYGYIVEYVEPMIMVEKDVLVSEGKRRASVIFEEPDEQGLIKTQIVDTSDW